MVESDLVFLIGSYLSICDGEINEKEHRLIHDRCNPSEKAIIEASKIFSDDPDKIPLIKLISEISKSSPEIKLELIETLVNEEYADGYADPAERKLIESIARTIKFPYSKLSEIDTKHKAASKDADEAINLSWADSLSASFHTFLFELKGEEESDDDYTELLSGSAFAKKVKSIAITSKNDLEIAENIIASYNSEIQHLRILMKKS